MDLMRDQTDLSYVKHEFLGPIWIKKWKISTKHNQQWKILCFLGYFLTCQYGNILRMVWTYVMVQMDLFMVQMTFWYKFCLRSGKFPESMTKSGLLSQLFRPVKKEIFLENFRYIATTQPTTQNNLKQLLFGWYY